MVSSSQGEPGNAGFGGSGLKVSSEWSFRSVSDMTLNVQLTSRQMYN